MAKNVLFGFKMAKIEFHYNLKSQNTNFWTQPHRLGCWIMATNPSVYLIYKMHKNLT